MNRYCANCGTEVDETAVFCPTCGQPIAQDVESEMPAAPAWPEPAQAPAAAGSAASYEGTVEAGRDEGPATYVEVEPDPEPEPIRSERLAAFDAPTRDLHPIEAAAVPPRATSPGRESSAGASPVASLPVTMPVTLSGWLIGVGAALGALGALIMLFNGFGAAVEIIVLVALLAVALTVFFSANLPAIPHLRLITLALVLVASGVALDRIGIAGAGVGELLLFLGAAAAAIGAIILELGRDQPLGVTPS